MASSVPSSAPSSGFVQGLLQSLGPWLTGGSPSALDNAFSQYGGTNGVISALLQDGPNPGAAAMGRAIEANQNAALNRAAARQKLAQQNIGLQKSAMMLPVLQAYYRAATAGAPSPQSGAQPSGAAPSQAGTLSPLGTTAASSAVPSTILAAHNARPAAPPGAPRPSLPGLFSAPTPAQIASTPVGGMSPQMLRLGGLLSGQSPLATAQQIRQQQLAIARQRYAPAIAQLDTLDKAQSPTQYVAASPQLTRVWQQVAPTLGFDPTKGFTDPNVRTAFSFLRNRIAGALMQPTVAPPVQVATAAGPLGSMYSRNPITGAVTQVKPEESLKAVVAPDGTVSYVTASQAAGRTPYESELYAPPQAIAGTAKLIANYEMPPLSGYALRSPIGAKIMAAVKEINPSYDATQYTTKQVAREKFATGKQGDTVRSLSVATSHLNMLSDAAHALAQHDTPVLNRLVNAIGVHITGANPKTNFDAMKEIVGDEVVKAIVGATGAEGDREAIKESFNAANSPTQIDGVIDKYEGLMGGQLRGLRRQYQKATGLHDFDSFVSSLARQQLNSAANSALGTASSTRGQTVRITGDAQYQALPSGTTFIAPDGTLRRKP